MPPVTSVIARVQVAARYRSRRPRGMPRIDRTRPSVIRIGGGVVLTGQGPYIHRRRERQSPLLAPYSMNSNSLQEFEYLSSRARASIPAPGPAPTLRGIAISREGATNTHTHTHTHTHTQGHTNTHTHPPRYRHIARGRRVETSLTPPGRPGRPGLRWRDP